MGGRDATGLYRDTVEVYDTSTAAGGYGTGGYGTASGGAWMSVAPMLAPRADHAAVAVGNMIYVFGGHDGSNPHLSTAEVYDASASAAVWTALPPMRWSRHGPSA